MKVSAPLTAARATARSFRRAWQWSADQVKHHLITRNRRLAFVLSLVTIIIAVASVHLSEWWFSPGVMILPILAGGLLLWPRALRIFFGFAAVALIYDILERKAGVGIIATIVLTASRLPQLARRQAGPAIPGRRPESPTRVSSHAYHSGFT